MNKLAAPTAKDIAKKERRDKAIELAKQRNELFKEYIDSGSNEKVCRRLSMSYLLFSVGQYYVEEIIEILSKYNQFHKKLKTRAVNLINCFDLFHEYMETLLTDSGDYESQQAHNQLCEDYEIFQEVCDRFMNADVRVGRMDAINRDDLRSEAVYLCQVKDCLIAPVQCFKWNGERWLEFVREPFPKWTETDQTITYVIDRVKTIIE